MTPEEFVSQVRVAVVRRNAAAYREEFESTMPQESSDAYGKRALALYQSLGQSDRAVFLEIMRQVMVDTVSSVFGILDGVVSLDGTQRPEFVLISGSEDGKLNGDLQELFLEAEEQDRQ